MAPKMYTPTTRSKDPTKSAIEKDESSPFAISRIPCNQPRCRNTAAACAGGKCWTCQAKAHRV